MRFVCDVMLGRLARWLRLAGFDTLYGAQATDQELAATCRGEGRWLLTRDRRLASAAGPRVVLLRGVQVEEQLAEVCTRLSLAARQQRWLSRCPRCNAPLREAAREAVAVRVPPYVAAHAQAFWECTDCGQVYWPGTHVPRIQARLATVLATRTPSGGGEDKRHG